MSVAIHGIGIISAIGKNANETITHLREGRSGVERMRYLPSEHKELPVGEVKMSNSELKSELGIPESQVVSRTTLLGVYATRQAISDAGLSVSDINSMRSVFISGTTVGNMDLAPDIQANWSLGSETDDIVSLCGLNSETCTVSTACSSALNALILGAEILKNDEADIVIAGGSEALSLLHLNGFNSLLILDHEHCRPFDDTRAGLNLGEGAAYVVMVKSGLAKGDVYITGYANRCDAFHQTASSDDGEGAFQAMTGALTMANIKCDDISYINAHGTGTPNNDISESRALQRVFGDRVPAVSSTKGYTGHTTSASGSIETVICILAMRHGFIPANVGWKRQIDGGITPSMGEEHAELHHVMCNSFGFGGNDSSIIISDSPSATKEKIERYDSEVMADVTITDESQLNELKEYISPMAARRMGKLMKAATLSSMKVLKNTGIEKPDAIITATAFGMFETSKKLLDGLVEGGEHSFSPTLFMQSTHNTIGSAVAIRNKCHGYNITYVQGEKSMEWALRDAHRLISKGRAKTVLVGHHDEFGQLYSRSMIIKRVTK